MLLLTDPLPPPSYSSPPPPCNPFIFKTNLILVYSQTSLRPQSSIKFTSIAKKRKPRKKNESLWWLRKYFPYFNRPRHRCLYTRMCIHNYPFTSHIWLLIHSAGWTVGLADECECQAEMTAIPPAYLLSYTIKRVVLLVRPGVELCSLYPPLPPLFFSLRQLAYTR